MSTSARSSEPSRGVDGRDLALLLLLALCAAALHARVLFADRTYFSIDLTQLNFAWRALTAEQLQRGQAPLWNPYAMLGMPLTGNMQTGVFHPVSTLFHLFPFAKALGWFLWLTQTLAAAWTYLWMRSWRFGRRPAMAAAAVFSLGGFFVGYLQFPNLLGAVGHWPLLALSSGSLELTALAAGLMFLAGYPPVWPLGVVCAAGLCFLWRERLPVAPRPSTAAAGTLLGLALAGAVLVPGMEAFARSARGRGLEPSLRVQNAVRPSGLAALVSPDLARGLSQRLQTPVPRRERVVFDDGGKETVFTFDSLYDEHFKDPSGIRYAPQYSFYLGALGALLAALGLWTRARARPWKALAAAAAACSVALLMLGSYSPLSTWLWSRLPGLQFLRGPSRLSILLVALAAPFAALGAQALRRPGAMARFAAWAPILVAAELLWIGWGYYPTMPGSYFRERGAVAEFLAASLEGGRYFQSTSSEVWAYVGKDVPSPAYRTFTEEVFRTFKHKLFGVSNSALHLAAASGSLDPMVPASSDEAIRTLEGAESGRLPGLMAWAGVRFWLSRTKDKGDPLVYRGQRLWHVYESPGGPGRAFWLPERARPALERPFADANPPEGFGALHALMEREDRVRIRGTSPEKGLVYAAEPFYPGWDLFVNGKKTVLRKALGAFVFFETEAGPVDARLIYRPRTWTAGAALSVLALLGLAWLGCLRLARAGAQ